MKQWRDQGVILRLGVFRESDLWLRLLCREHGAVTVFAFGGAKSKRRFCGCFDRFNSLDCLVNISRDGRYFNLAEAMLIEGTRNLRANSRSLGIAANCLAFVGALEIDGESAPACFAVTENLRARLEKDENPHRLLPLFFRLRIAAALGFQANFTECGKCGSSLKGGGVFVANTGNTFCETCARPIGVHEIRLSRAALEIMDGIQRGQPEDWRPLALTRREMGACGQLVDAFIQYHLGLAWDNGYFRRV